MTTQGKVPDYDKRVGGALDAAESELNRKVEQDKLVTLSTGVVLALKPVSPMIFTHIGERFAPPPPPKVWLEDKGREEINPAHPDYVRHLEQLDISRGLASVDAMIVFGTTLVTSPESIPALDDEEWADQLEAIGITFRREKHNERYLAWVKYIAAPTVGDMQELSLALTRVMGVQEEDVQRAVASFRGDEKRTAD